MVGLAAFHLQPQRRALRGQPRGDIGQRIIAIDFRLARAEQVEVGSIEDQNFAQRHDQVSRFGDGSGILP
jgi:hypothetical protein